MIPSSVTSIPKKRSSHRRVRSPALPHSQSLSSSPLTEPALFRTRRVWGIPHSRVHGRLPPLLPHLPLHADEPPGLRPLHGPPRRPLRRPLLHAFLPSAAQLQRRGHDHPPRLLRPPQAAAHGPGRAGQRAPAPAQTQQRQLHPQLARRRLRSAARALARARCAGRQGLLPRRRRRLALQHLARGPSRCACCDARCAGCVCCRCACAARCAVAAGEPVVGGSPQGAWRKEECRREDGCVSWRRVRRRILRSEEAGRVRVVPRTRGGDGVHAEWLQEPAGGSDDGV